jgi:fermentation-respiration switch protein FrsA (DUF1100 family)
MPIETTTDAIVRPLAPPREKGIGNAGLATQFGEKARRFMAHAIAASGAVASRLKPRKPRSAPRAMTVLGWIGIVAACLYVGLTAMVYVAQRSLMYFPDTVHTAPAAAGLPDAEEVSLTASDGVNVIAWHVAARDGKPVILYFHGNGGALRNRVERFRKLITDGIGLVALEYRGYGGLSGSPSEQGLIADAEAAYAFAAARYQATQLVLWGESLGSGVAVALAAEKPVGRVILEAPFTSALAVGQRHYWYLPVRLLMKDQFRSDERIAKVTAPLMIMHGMHDRIIPYAMGEQLFDLANKPKHIVRFLDGGHEDLDTNGALDAVGRFLAGDLD